LRGLESAIASDPNFTAASVAAARLLLESGDRDGARKLLATAVSTHPDPIDQARLEYVAATAAGDTAARVQALQTLARLTPMDRQVPRELGELHVLQRKFEDAVRNFETITRLDPEDAQAWNQLGYGYGFAQNLAGARRALERYRQLLPLEEVNQLDSLGKVSFYICDLSCAERYLM
jgi:Flp pilus assembly protein TadD